VVCLGAGCESGPEKRPKVSYRASAKENFLKGQQAFGDEDYLEAIEYFRFVKSKFPYSAYATQAELLVADAHFARERYLEAADAYTSFIKLHPKHARVPYATFRIGLCYFMRMPDTYWFMPPAYELDQKETLRAIQELEAYLQRFPQDDSAPEAREKLRQAKRRMAEEEAYVMDFYRRKGNPRGVVWRAEKILQSYGDAGLDEEALFRKGEALVALEETDHARRTLEQQLQAFPAGEFAETARELLTRLPPSPTQEVPEAAPEGAVPPGAAPEGAVPPGAAPEGAVPPGAAPEGAVPPGAAPEEPAVSAPPGEPVPEKDAPAPPGGSGT